MKKIISIIVVLILTFSVLSISAFATNDSVKVAESIEYLEDGSYIVTTLVEKENVSMRATSTKTGSRTSVLYNANDEAMVTLKLTGTFSYTGSSATCTNASTSYTIHNSAWKVTAATATKSGNKATGSFTAKQYFLGIAIQTINDTLTISCSNTGVLS